MSVREISLTEGKYVITVSALKQSVDEPSAMAPYLGANCIVTATNDDIFITLTFNNHQVITGFQVEKNEKEFVPSIDRHVNMDENIRYEIFQLNQLQTIINARVQYKVEHEGQSFTGDEQLRLQFDHQSLKNLEHIDF